MNYIISASTDVGIKKETNQDSLTVKILETPQGKMTFAVLCDGMGGLSKGEVASASVIEAFSNWALHCLPLIFQTSEINEHIIFQQWNQIIQSQNQSIMNYGKSKGVSLGTTVVVMLITQTNYYILNVGDSRAYEISDKLYKLTADQTVVAKEILQGKLTVEQAKVDPRRNVLLQCVGASNIVNPDVLVGKTKLDSIYMLCSDGFRHEITPQEIQQAFNPNILLDKQSMTNNAEKLIELNKTRLEKDNISVITIKTLN